jgi:hypothetical protein
MGRWAFTIFVLTVTGFVACVAVTYFLRYAMGDNLPYALTSLGATPKNMGIGFGIAFGVVCAAWAWGWSSNFK